jgi:hypothetical protein
MPMYETPDEKVPRARAWIYSGQWVANCPRPPDPVTGKGCGGVEFLYEPSRPNGPRDREKLFFACSNCGYQAEISWPRRREDLMRVLMLRPVPETRHWYPTDHPDAIRWGNPHGQTVADLMAENEEHGVSNEPLKELR